MHLPFSPFKAFLVVGLWAFVCHSSVAQPSDGTRPQETVGIALIKPQAWSADTQALPVEFSALTDRTGYFELRTAKSPALQIPKVRVVRLILFPAPPAELVTPQTRASLEKSATEFVELGNQFPAIAKLLQPPIEVLRAEIAQYDAGNVKVDGAWQPRVAYYAARAQALADLLRVDIANAAGEEPMDLEMNQYYLGLQDLALSEPTVKPVAESMKNLFDGVARKKERQELLAQLATSTSLNEATAMVAKLRGLIPEEDPSSLAFIAAWDLASQRADEITKAATEVKTAYEANMSELVQAKQWPVPSSEIVAQIEKLTASVQVFLSASPPPAIVFPASSARALATAAQDLPKASKLVGERQLLLAKGLLDPFARQADAIGPVTAAALAAWQKSINVEIEKFQALRAEAKMLAETDRKEEAIKKYQAAMEVIPEANIALQIEALQK